MQIIQKFITKNDCYNINKARSNTLYNNFQDNGPKGLMLHSVGCNQPKASVFLRHWDKADVEIAVHGVIDGLDGNTYQALPWNYRGWHAGGTANNTHIGVEMGEPACIKYTHGATFTCSDVNAAREIAERTYRSAVELFAYLCKEYNLDPMKEGVVISHAEGHERGVASGHADPEHLWNQLDMGYTMDTFRTAVKAKMGGCEPASLVPNPQNPTEPIAYGKLKTTMNIRTEPSVKAEIVTVYSEDTIVEILEVLPSGWLRIKLDEGFGYVSNVAEIKELNSLASNWIYAKQKLLIP